MKTQSKTNGAVACALKIIHKRMTKRKRREAAKGEKKTIYQINKHFLSRLNGLWSTDWRTARISYFDRFVMAARRSVCLCLCLCVRAQAANENNTPQYIVAHVHFRFE